jgi:pilus assembly protein CpaE
MPNYFLSTNVSREQSVALERSIKSVVPDLVKISNLEEIARDIASQPSAPVYILVAGPGDDAAYIDRFVAIATQYSGRFYFVLMSADISTANYKRLVRTGNADWVSIVGAAPEISEIFAKRRGAAPRVERAPGEPSKPKTIAFLPAAGGVGNTTLLSEIGVWLKLQKENKDRKICVVDLDFQTSHICDYLDIEPRLQIQEFSEGPERLDEQLFDIYVSHHASGLDVFAAPRSKFDLNALSLSALEILFEMIAKRYDTILIDLPVTWFAWTVDIISNSDAVILTGINTIPCLRQLSQSLAVVRDARPGPGKQPPAIVINRCDRTLLGGIERRQHVESVLKDEQIFYVGNDAVAMLECVNTGTRLAQSGGSRKTMKEISAIAEFCTGVTAPSVKAA